MTEYSASWSGGKDSCFAYWKAISQGLKVNYLLNFINADSTKSMSHGLDHRLIALQARAMRLPILQQKVTWETYEAGCKAALAELKRKGVTGLITGDIYLQEHRDWVERVCRESGMEALLPLWKLDTTRLLTDFINSGFKAIIVSAKGEFFGKEWLGRELDSKLYAELCQLAQSRKVDPCGEGGEYHTFVYDGPAFRRPVKILKTTTEFRENYWFLNILEYKLG